jgi:Tol biopolymer transport system component
MPKPLFLLGCLLLATLGQPAQAPTGRPAVPTVLAPGIISTGGFESHPAFTPDGRTLYFVKSSPSFTFWTICVSHFANGRWGEPEVAPFSGQYSDADPFITRDGAHLYFISTRPVTPGGEAKDLDIWVMDRAASGWTPPRPLPAPINTAGAEWFPTVASNGTLYFGSDRPGGQGRTDLYRAGFVDGRYGDAENLGAVVNSDRNDFEPFVDPDERFVIFMSGRAGGQGLDLWVTYNRAGTWTPPANLGATVNSPGSEYSPALSPDGRTFFWASTRETFDTGGRRLSYRELNDRLTRPGNGLGDIYQIDLSALHLEVSK